MFAFQRCIRSHFSFQEQNVYISLKMAVCGLTLPRFRDHRLRWKLLNLIWLFVCRDTSYIAHSGEDDLIDRDRDKQEEHLSNSRISQGVVAFPDLLAPASRMENILYVEPDNSERNRQRFRQPSSYRVSKKTSNYLHPPKSESSHFQISTLFQNYISISNNSNFCDIT